LIGILYCLFKLPTLTYASTFISPLDPNIVYMGRVDQSDPTNVAFDWPCISINAVFTGSSSISAKFNGGNNYFYAIVDGIIAAELKTNDQTQLYTLAQGLDSTKTHNVSLFKKTEASYVIVELLLPLQVVYFQGFMLDTGAKLLPYSLPQRKLEVFSDSDSNGFGVDGPDVWYCLLDLVAYENCYYDYVSLLARRFNADYHVEAFSAKGVVHNAASLEQISEGSMPTYWNRTIATDTHVWDFSKWIPDAILILLGSNDYFNPPYPTDQQFINGYINMLQAMATSYPSSPTIINVCVGDLPTNEEPCLHVEQASSKFKANYPSIYYIHVNGSMFNYPDDFGCEDHRNRHGQQILADYLYLRMKDILGW